jgi:hypothetical protein
VCYGYGGAIPRAHAVPRSLFLLWFSAGALRHLLRDVFFCCFIDRECWEWKGAPHRFQFVLFLKKCAGWDRGILTLGGWGPVRYFDAFSNRNGSHSNRVTDHIATV